MVSGYLNNLGISDLKKELVRLRKSHGRTQRFRDVVYRGFSIEPVDNLGAFIRKKLKTTNRDFTKWVLQL